MSSLEVHTLCIGNAWCALSLLPFLLVLVLTRVFVRGLQC